MSARSVLFLPFLFSLALVPAAGQVANEKDKPAAALFPDPNLEAVVRSHVFGKRDNKEPLTVDDVKSLSVISGRDKPIKSLSGIEKCAALMMLELTGSEITDLTPLRELTNLQSITLSRNKVKDLSPLAGMARLQYLELSGNQVSDLSPLKQLVALNSLYLSGNAVADLSPLAGMERLWSLYIDGNNVTDLAPVAGMKWLSTLDARRNKIKDLTPLAGLTNLKYLMLDGNQISDLTPLVTMAKKDAAGEKRFAPYWQVWLGGNPLSGAAKSTQLAELKKYSHTVSLTPAGK